MINNSSSPSSNNNNNNNNIGKNKITNNQLLQPPGIGELCWHNNINNDNNKRNNNNIINFNTNICSDWKKKHLSTKICDGQKNNINNNSGTKNEWHTSHSMNAYVCHGLFCFSLWSCWWTRSANTVCSFRPLQSAAHCTSHWKL